MQSLAQQQQQQPGSSLSTVQNPQHIKEVWASTLESEMAAIRDIVDEFPFVSMVRCLPQLLINFCGRPRRRTGKNSRET